MARGRPRDYDPSYHPRKANQLALLGLNEEEMATILDIAESTLSKWKIDFPEFSEALKEGKVFANAHIASRLYNRAEGLTTKEVVYEDIEERIDHGDGTWHYEPKTRVKTTFKEEAPNTTAAIFFLKNRDPKRWKDKQEISHSLTETQEFTIGGQKITF